MAQESQASRDSVLRLRPRRALGHRPQHAHAPRLAHRQQTHGAATRRVGASVIASVRRVPTNA